MPLNLPQLPPDLQEKLAPHMEKAKSLAETLGIHLGPLWEELVSLSKGFVKKMEESAPGATVGHSFKHLAVVGLNRVEVLLAGEQDSVLGESWQDLVDDTLKRNTAMVFFAPRGLDGQPVNPYLFLVGEGAQSDEDEAGVDTNVLTMAMQATQGLALLDFCRISPASPNTLNILLAGDTLFHWDNKDNYVLPTSSTGWVRDAEQVIKGYPRTTRVHIYTQWETDVFPPSERIAFHKLRDLPLDDATWLNQPTFQEKYGSHILTLALIVAGLVYAGLMAKGHTLSALQEEVYQTEQQIPRGGQFGDLEKAITEQEKQFAKRDVFPLLVKDAARAAQRANFQIANFEVKVDDVQNPPVQYVMTWEAKKDVYQGWLQEEPVAREVMLNSAFLQALRKPPVQGVFKLEGLVLADDAAKAYTLQIKRYARTPAMMRAASPTQIVSPGIVSSTGPKPVLPKQAFVSMSPQVAPAPREVILEKTAPAAGPVASSGAVAQDGGDE